MRKKESAGADGEPKNDYGPEVCGEGVANRGRTAAFKLVFKMTVV